MQVESLAVIAAASTAWLGLARAIRNDAWRTYPAWQGSCVATHATLDEQDAPTLFLDCGGKKLSVGDYRSALVFTMGKTSQFACTISKSKTTSCVPEKTNAR
jgi:hypothetical protein